MLGETPGFVEEDGLVMSDEEHEPTDTKRATLLPPLAQMCWKSPVALKINGVARLYLSSWGRLSIRPSFSYAPCPALFNLCDPLQHFEGMTTDDMAVEGTAPGS